MCSVLKLLYIYCPLCMNPSTCLASSVGRSVCSFVFIISHKIGMFLLAAVFATEFIGFKYSQSFKYERNMKRTLTEAVEVVGARGDCSRRWDARSSSCAPRSYRNTHSCRHPFSCLPVASREIILWDRVPFKLPIVGNINLMPRMSGVRVVLTVSMWATELIWFGEAMLR